jgi:NDP-sugar pyrophosphorylase family protein
LRSILADRPKVLARIRGRTFLSYLLDQVSDAGVRKVVLCTGYMADAVRDEFGGSYGRLQIAYSQEKEPLGTGGALRLAMPYFESDQVLVMNGDSYCRADLSAFARSHRERCAKASIILARIQNAARFGRVELDAAGAVTGYHEKDGAEAPGWINAGIYLLSRAVIEEIAPGRSVSIEREVFPEWIGRGLCGYRTQGRFLDIGTPESYDEAADFFAREAVQ